MNKHDLRLELLLKRKSLDKAKKFDLDLEIQSRLLLTKEYRDCDKILVYVSNDLEIDTKGIIHAAFANKKKVAVPVTNDDYSLSFYYINSLKELKQGKFGIMEPDNRDNKVVDFDNSICVIPALCCDLSGNRIGYGKGCYDRFLSEYTGEKVCLVYGDNVFPSVVSESTDVKVDLIVSDLFVKRT